MEIMEEYIDISLAIGLALLVGLERGWHLKDEDEGTRVAGIRTFAITGIFSALSVYLSKMINQYIFIVAFFTFAIIVAVVIYRINNQGDIGITTEVALITTFLISALAAYGFRYIATASGIILVGFLSLKPQIHSFVKRIAFDELIALVKFLVLIGIIYPILPDLPLGTWTSIRYTDIFKIVIILSFLSFAGYIAIKIVGTTKGVIFSSLLGGLVSSTAVTVNLSKYYNENGNLPEIYIFGILTSWCVMFFRVIVLVAIFNYHVVRDISIVMLSMVLIILINLYFLKKSISTSDGVKIDIKNPIDIISSIKFALFIAIVVFLAEKGKEIFGKASLIAIAAFSGLGDVDAITVYMSKLGVDETFRITAILSIFIAVVMNTLVKCGITFIIGGKQLGINILKVTFVAVLVGFLVLLLLIN